MKTRCNDEIGLLNKWENDLYIVCKEHLASSICFSDSSTSCYSRPPYATHGKISYFPVQVSTKPNLKFQKFEHYNYIGKPQTDVRNQSQL